MVKPIPCGARAARRPCVFPSSILSDSSNLLTSQLIVNVQTVVGVFSLLNDYRLSQGKPALGWLNAWLYTRGLNGLNDITYGSNPGCHTEGFSAGPGWDPVCPAGHLFLLSTLANYKLHRLRVSGRPTLINWKRYLMMSCRACCDRTFLSSVHQSIRKSK